MICDVIEYFLLAVVTCGEVLDVSESGVLQSPNYPDNYPNELLCSWTISVPHGGAVVIDVNQFSVEEGDTDALAVESAEMWCFFDFLAVSTI